jgi:hypothetical protein
MAVKSKWPQMSPEEIAGMLKENVEEGPQSMQAKYPAASGRLQVEIDSGGGWQEALRRRRGGA